MFAPTRHADAANRNGIIAWQQQASDDCATALVEFVFATARAETRCVCGTLLMSATNPESGTVNYGYDSGGRLVSKTDAKGQRIEYGHDV
jgi:YD repeat-containing protein